MITLALTWLCVVFGLVAKSVESASNLPMPLLLLPFLGSGFAPTDSMPAAVRWFADHQPFTPFTETLRGLLVGTEIGSDGIVTVVWCTAITMLSYLWAKSLYNATPPSPESSPGGARSTSFGRQRPENGAAVRRSAYGAARRQPSSSRASSSSA